MLTVRAADGHRAWRNRRPPNPGGINLPSRPGLAASNKSRCAFVVGYLATSDRRTRLDVVRTVTG